MKGLSTEQINRTFRESLFSLCVKYKIPPIQMTMSVRIFEKGNILLQLCQNAIPQFEIGLSDILTHKMIGLRFSPIALEKLFKAVHNTFLKETKIDNPARISLVCYQSEKAQCPCIGILRDEKTYTVLKLSEVIEAIQLESEQQN